MSLTLRTADVAVPERFDFWRDVVCDAFVPLRAEPGDGEFHGELRTVRLGAVQLSSVEATAHTVRRTPRTISATDGDYFKIGLQVRGYCVLTQDGREAPLTPGDFAVYDTTRPYSLSFDDTYRQLVLMVPRERLRLRPEEIARITAVRVSGRHGVGALVSPLLLRLADHFDEYESPAGPRLADNIVDLLVTLISGQLELDSPAPDSGRRALLIRITSFIESHLGDPDLGPETIAAAHYISTRYLHKLFSQEGTTVSALIRERRLEHCRRDLRDPLQLTRPVSAIAARWGFVDAAHFSRIFRSAYGASPREYRLTSEPFDGITISVG